MSRLKYQKRSEEFFRRYYSQLVGATIVEYEGLTDFGDDSVFTKFPAFSVRLADGRKFGISISQDEEGNGGGVIHGLEEPSMDDYDKAHKLNKYEEKGA